MSTFEDLLANLCSLACRYLPCLCIRAPARHVCQSFLQREVSPDMSGILTYNICSPISALW